MELLLAIFIKTILAPMIGGLAYPIYLYLGGESTALLKVIGYGVFGGIIGYVGYYVMLIFWTNIEAYAPGVNTMKDDTLRIGSVSIGFFAKNIVDLIHKRANKGK